MELQFFLLIFSVHTLLNLSMRYPPCANWNISKPEKATSSLLAAENWEKLGVEHFECLPTFRCESPHAHSPIEKLCHS